MLPSTPIIDCEVVPLGASWLQSFELTLGSAGV